VAPLNGFELMYESHAAREDTIVFSAWKKAIGESSVKEMGNKFEDIEKKQFGGDSFDKAVKEIGEIEQMGSTDLGQFSAPAPPGHRCAYDGEKYIRMFGPRVVDGF